MFVPVTGVEQAVALRREGLLYYQQYHGAWRVIEGADFPRIVISLGDEYVRQHYAYYLED